MKQFGETETPPVRMESLGGGARQMHAIADDAIGTSGGNSAQISALCLTSCRVAASIGYGETKVCWLQL